MLTIEQAKAHPLWEEQKALEDEMRSMGIAAARERTAKAIEKGQETRNAPVRRLLNESHDVMVEAIKGFYADVEAKKAGRKHSAYAYLKPMDIDVVAHLTCRVVLDLSAQKKSLINVAIPLAEALEDECNFRKFKAEHKAGFAAAKRRVEKVTHQRHLKRSVLGTARGLGVEAIEWPKRDLIVVGTKLVELFVEKTGLAILNKTSTKITVETAPEAREWIEAEGRNCELLAPTYMPTLIQPRPWTSPFEGGYWTGRVRRLTLMKRRTRAYLEEMAEDEMPEVYAAVNALQDTAWHVNAKVYEVMAHLWETKSESGMVPLVDPQPLPNKPVWLVEGLTKDQMTPEQLEVFKEWKIACAKVHADNAEEEGKRNSFMRQLWVAGKFKDREEFFFPHNLDWRGRAYPVPLYLQPQGNDAARGLLEFSEMAPINTQAAADWLAVHGAGLWGFDKETFANRVQWVEERTAQIVASAENPYDNRFWMEAEKPWQALAFCFDWAAFKQEGFGYLSSLPIQMDGSCNGIQNLSAMLLDERGGRAVNMLPSLKPNDIYMEVGKVVIAQVEKDAAEGNEFAQLWVGKVTRKVVKRPVMTLAYGAERYGFVNQVLEDTVRPAVKEDPTAFGGHSYKAAEYMGGIIWNCVGQVVQAATTAMKWLQDVAVIMAEEGLPVNWRTPTGLRVMQDYRVQNKKNVDLVFQKVAVQVKVAEDSLKLDKKSQKSGIAPNWVHSLDASHMTKTICAASLTGVRSFSFIHDSYGTHAGNAQALADILREQFVAMYGSSCVLEGFRRDLQAAVDRELPPVPPKGTLDLSQVLESAFFFH
jgi:DNA-directed RNA polymerase